MKQSRRAFLCSLGTVSAGSLAGCGGSSRVTPSGTPRPTVSTDAEFDGYLAPTANYDGTVADAREESNPTVLVGAAGNGGNRAYSPPAIAVSSGTTVVWEWTGAGGGHNVLNERERFESDLVTQQGHTFEYTFNSPGIYKYYCTPHLRTGMKGVVAVGNVL